MSVAGSALTGRRQCDPHTLKAMAAGLKQAVAADAPVVRDVPSKKLGDIVVEERDDRVYAQMDIGPVLLRAAGADVSKTGCRGLQTSADAMVSGRLASVREAAAHRIVS